MAYSELNPSGYVLGTCIEATLDGVDIYIILLYSLNKGYHKSIHSASTFAGALGRCATAK